MKAITQEVTAELHEVGTLVRTSRITDGPSKKGIIVTRNSVYKIVSYL